VHWASDNTVMLLSGALPMRLSVVTVAQDEQSLGAVKLITL